MLVVHHLNNSRSQRILWLLEELNLPYQIVKYEREKTMLAPDSLKKVHPLGHAPVLQDGSKTIAESGAIIEYILDTYGENRLRPAANTEERISYNFWMHYAEGSLMPLMFLSIVFAQIQRSSPVLIKPVVNAIVKNVGSAMLSPETKRNLDFVEVALAGTPWFAGGEFTAADIQMSFPLEASHSRAGLDNSHPRTMDFLNRIHERPAYKRAIERGGHYELAK